MGTACLSDRAVTQQFEWHSTLEDIMREHTAAKSDFTSHFFRTLSSRSLHDGSLTLAEATGKSYTYISEHGVTYALCSHDKAPRTLSTEQHADDTERPGAGHAIAADPPAPSEASEPKQGEATSDRVQDLDDAASKIQSAARRRLHTVSMSASDPSGVVPPKLTEPEREESGDIAGVTWASQLFLVRRRENQHELFLVPRSSGYMFAIGGAQCPRDLDTKQTALRQLCRETGLFVPHRSLVQGSSGFGKRSDGVDTVFGQRVVDYAVLLSEDTCPSDEWYGQWTDLNTLKNRLKKNKKKEPDSETTNILTQLYTRACTAVQNVAETSPVAATPCTLAAMDRILAAVRRRGQRASNKLSFSARAVPSLARLACLVLRGGEEIDERTAPAALTADSAADEAANNSQGGVVRDLVVNMGILDRSIVSSFDTICQVVDCVNVMPTTAVASDIARVLDYGNPYSDRRAMPRNRYLAVPSTRSEPGNILVRPYEPPEGVSSSVRRPTVVSFTAQWQPGKPSSNPTIRPGPSDDSSKARQGWFAQGLEQLSRMEPRPASVAFPWQLGDSDGKRSAAAWGEYRSLIEEFALKNQDIVVAIVQHKRDAVSSMYTANHLGDIHQCAATAQAIVEGVSDPQERACLETFNETLTQILFSQPEDAKDLSDDLCNWMQGERHSMSANAVHGLATTMSEVRETLKEREQAAAHVSESLAKHDASIKDSYREVVAEALAAGRVSIEELEQECNQTKHLSFGSADIQTVGQSGTSPNVGVCCTVGNIPQSFHSSSRESFQTTALPSSSSSEELVVSSGDTPAMPMRLKGVKVVGANGALSDISAYMSTPSSKPSDSANDPIHDGGSGLSLMGPSDHERLARMDPTCISVLQPDEVPTTAIRYVRGVAGLTEVAYYVTLRLSLGGVVVRFVDMPVLRTHKGILLGNDFSAKASAQITMRPDHTASVTFANGNFVSKPLHAVCSPTAPQYASVFEATSCLSEQVQESAPFDLSTYSHDVIGGVFDNVHTKLELDRRTERVLNDVAPVVLTPNTVTVPKWSDKWIKVRFPAAAMDGHDVAIVPIESGPDLGVLVSAGMHRPSADGYTWVKLTNRTQQNQSIPMLTPIGHFIVNPAIAGTDLEFTVDEIIDQVHKGDSWTAADLACVKDMLKSQRRLFSTILGWAHGFKMKIETPRIDSGEVPPPASPNRRRSPEEWAALKVVIDKLLKQKLIEPTRSPYNALPIPIRKPDGSYRLVLDYRAINNLTTKDAYPLPDVDSNLSQLGNANWFSTLDLLMGFHQCEIDETDGSVLKTAFGTPWGQFAFRRMPMGLTSSPGTFMRLVDAALRGLPPGHAVAYCDDVIIPTSGTFEEHVKQVGEVFTKLIESGFTVRADKVHIGMKEVPYLGFIVGAYGTRPSPEKLAALFKITQTSMGTDPARAARFAGMIGVYHKFIPYLHTTLAPFHDLKQKGSNAREIMGSLQFKAAFAELMRQLHDITALTRPDYSKPFYLDSDIACSHGIGAVLSQRQNESDAESHKPITFRSRRMTKLERGMPVREQECLGLVESLLEWRPYVLHAKVILRTDHKSLQWMMKTKHREGSPMQSWALKIEEFNIEIQWQPGSLHMVPDFFSRPGSGGETEGGAVEAQDEDDIKPVQEKERPELGLDAHSTVFTAEADNTGSTGAKTDAVQLRQFERAAAAFLTRGEDGQLHVLVEKHDSSFTLPSTSIDQFSSVSAREQLKFQLLSFYDKEPLTQLLKSAAAIRSTRGKDRVSTQFFVIDAREQLKLLETADLVLPSWQPVSSALCEKLSHADDSAMVQSILLESVASQRSRWHLTAKAKYVLQRVSDTVSPTLGLTHKSSVHTAQAFAVAESQCPVPSIREAAGGPAFCETDADIAQAMASIWEYLNQCSGDERVAAVDLEGNLGGRNGHVDTLQISLDISETDRLTYVFDCNNRILLDAYGPQSMRALLEDPSIIKIFHCCQGDTSTLYWEYDISSRGVFDTAVADCLIRGTMSVKGLEKVLIAYLGHKAVHLSMKGSLVHIPGMFAERPLPYHLFVYAYEDVTLCPQLYREQCKVLVQKGFLELCLTLSQQRAPPDSLPALNKLAQPPNRIAIALCDEEEVLCLRVRATGGICLPAGLISDQMKKANLTHKRMGRDIWQRVMGDPPKPHAKMAINARLQKGIRVGNTVLMIASIPSCSLVLPSVLEAALATGVLVDHEITISSRSSAGGVAPPEDKAVLQMVGFWASRKQTAYSDEGPSTGTEEDPNTAETNVVTGPTKVSIDNIHRAALVLHSDTEVYSVRVVNETGVQYSVPSWQLEQGRTLKDTAIRGFEVLAGTQLLRGGATPTAEQRKRMTAPCAATAIGTAFDKMQGPFVVPNPGNNTMKTAFFSCYLPDLRKHLVALVSARREHGGFRLTDTLAKRYGKPNMLPLCGIGLHTWDHTLQDGVFNSFDVAGISVIRSEHAKLCIQDDATSSAAFSAQHSEPQDTSDYV